jgi:hypothetical protein
MEDAFPDLECVWLIARRADKLNAAAKPLKRVQARVLPMDLCDRTALAALKETLAAERPDVTLLINNAGCGVLGNVGETDWREQVKVADLNVSALTALTGLVVPYLKKGGRISSVAAIAGGLLNLKPVLGIRDGEILTLGKARGSKQGNNLLVKEIEKAGGVDFSMPVLLGYTGLSDVLLKKYMDDSAFLWEGRVDRLDYVPIGSVIGTHAGPGAVAVAFFKQ